MFIFIYLMMHPTYYLLMAVFLEIKKKTNNITQGLTDRNQSTYTSDALLPLGYN